MTLETLIGIHEPNGGEGLTLQDLYELLQAVPLRVRRASYVEALVGEEFSDVTGISFAQSDQAEKWEFKAYIRTQVRGNVRAISDGTDEA